MPFQYRCGGCDAAGDPRPRRLGARTDQAEHRRLAHGGLNPGGDGIRYAAPSARGPAITVGVLLLLVVVKELTGLAPEDIARHLGLL
ncbi:hypothetical protein [Streptomyces sp. DH37]|uniref:hypothetical protein n=1 Tax=Streptomyces sp. DH37 TaxID=3040122 RepID=UPI00244236FF|nr:hypothetical protein [Streptomyces sp. DH37]MDG9703778.1 hypothetical protein [Streptomyces sp. DH37]